MMVIHISPFSSACAFTTFACARAAEMCGSRALCAPWPPGAPWYLGIV